MTTPTPHGAPEMTNIDLAKAHGADICDEWDIVDKTEREQISFTTDQLDAYTSAAIEQAQSKHEGKSMNNEQAKAAALSWHGEAGGELLPQLTANELAGIVNEAIQQAAGAVPELPGDEIIAMARVHSSENHYSGGRCVRMEFTPSNTLTFVKALAASPSPLGREAGSSDHLVPCADGGVKVPLTSKQLVAAARAAQIAFCLDKFGSFEVAFAREIEAVHGIKEAS